MWETGIWNLLEWPAPTWDQANCWQAAPDHGWLLEQAGKWMFTVSVGFDTLDLSGNELMHIAIAISVGTPASGPSVLLGRANDFVDASVGDSRITFTAWRPFAKEVGGVLVQSWGRQDSSRGHALAPVFTGDSYFNYAKFGADPR